MARLSLKNVLPLEGGVGAVFSLESCMQVDLISFGAGWNYLLLVKCSLFCGSPVPSYTNPFFFKYFQVLVLQLMGLATRALQCFFYLC